MCIVQVLEIEKMKMKHSQNLQCRCVILSEQPLPAVSWIDRLLCAARFFLLFFFSFLFFSFLFSVFLLQREMS